jgi:hypothetical protein
MKYVDALFLASFLYLGGCAAADKYFTPDPVTGKSPSQATAEAAQPLLPAPYGEIGLASVIALQNAYLGYRKATSEKKPAA